VCGPKSPSRGLPKGRAETPRQTAATDGGAAAVTGAIPGDGLERPSPETALTMLARDVFDDEAPDVWRSRRPRIGTPARLVTD